MKQFESITESSIIKCKSVGINADQLDELVDSIQLKLDPIERVQYRSQDVVLKSDAKISHNAVADLLHKAHNMVSDNADTKKLRVPDLQLQIVAKALEFYRCNGGLDADTQFDCHSLKELFSGNHIVNVDVDEDKYRDLAHVDLPVYLVDAMCPNCDHVFDYMTDQEVVECGNCGFESARCDFPDVQVQDDDDPSGYCDNSSCRKAIYDGGSYCDTDCERN